MLCVAVTPTTLIVILLPHSGCSLGGWSYEKGLTRSTLSEQWATIQGLRQLLCDYQGLSHMRPDFLRSGNKIQSVDNLNIPAMCY